MQTAKALLTREPHGLVVINGFFLREDVRESPEGACASGMRQMVSIQAEFTDTLKKWFVTTLLRVARAHNGLSVKEWQFIRRF